MQAIHTDPNRRHDFVVLFDVTNGNPNGDPDAGNLPRNDPDTGHGLVTDVALKRKIRNFVALSDHPIFIQSQVSLNQLIVDGFRKVGVTPAQTVVEDEELAEWLRENAPEEFALDGDLLTYGGESNKQTQIERALLGELENTPENRSLRNRLRDLAKQLAAAGGQQIDTPTRDKARRQLCRDYYDIRMFGAVLATGLNAGQVRGPMQITFARSIDPIQPRDLTITRQARTTGERMLTGGTEMGRKQLVSYGLYRAHGFFSPTLAIQTGVTAADLTLFWEAAEKMFWHDRSAARPEMEVRGLYVFTHDSPLGNVPAHRLFERVRISRRGDAVMPRSFGDYSVEVDATSLPDGVTLTTLEG